MLAVLLLCVCMGGAWSAEQDAPQFNRDVRPILAENCFLCHGPEDAGRKADLRLDERESALPVLSPGQPEASKLLQRITANDPDERMPPADAHKELTREDRDVLAAWISSGAEYQRHWSFIPPERPALPEVSRADWPENGIDFFILRRLEAEGLTPAPAADKAMLLRRVTHDLTGLPPTPREVAAFLADTEDGAYARVIGRLLASPRYGEHMAVPWLDAARYADTDGYQNDRFRYMHVWRDWVIEAMNRNLPFDEFVIEQLAGDMLPDATLRQQIATGFNRNHRINSEAGSIPAEWLVENVVDRVDTLGMMFLGLTITCARCHDHKYEPVSQREYYRLFAIFNNVPEWGLGPNNGNSPPFIKVPESWPMLSPEEDRLIVPEPYKLKESQGAVIRPHPGGEDTVMVMQEMDTPRKTYLLNRGRYDDPDTSEVMTPGVPAALLAEGVEEPTNRLELARWLMDPAHPLTARVTVNRYWQQFFGRGLVETAENFGTQGTFPSHAELLDWLATEFIRIGWDVKAFHKIIVMSATYRQSPAVSPELLARDPENRLLARGARTRLSGQQLRDQALFVSGLLVEKIGGRPVKPYMPPGIWKSMTNAKYEQGSGADLYRRSIYTYWRRTTPPPTMMNFNSAPRETCIVRQDKTNTPLQALTLMNNITFVEAARGLAERMLAAANDVDAQLADGFLRVTARPPAPEEAADLRDAFDAFRAELEDAPARAEALLAVGEKPRNPELDPIDVAAMTLCASAILNLDEAIVRN